MNNLSKYVIAYDVLYVYNENISGKDMINLLSDFITCFPGEPSINWISYQISYETSDNDYELYFAPSSSSWIINISSEGGGNIEEYLRHCKTRYLDESELFKQICGIANNMNNSFDRYYFINRFYLNKSVKEIMKETNCSTTKIYTSEKRIEKHFLERIALYRNAYSKMIKM